MRIHTIALVALVSICVSACRDEEETRTVEWYQANKESHQSKLAECKNNPGELMNTPNCMNAQQAALLNMSGSSKLDYSKAFK